MRCKLFDLLVRAYVSSRALPNAEGVYILPDRRGGVVCACVRQHIVFQFLHMYKTQQTAFSSRLVVGDPSPTTRALVSCFRTLSL